MKVTIMYLYCVLLLLLLLLAVAVVLYHILSVNMLLILYNVAVVFGGLRQRLFSGHTVAIITLYA